MPRLIIIRGLPGSGKSTLAKRYGAFHIEADMYHVRNGEYQFNKEKQKDAHEWCFNMFSWAIDSGVDVVVSNTFTRVWEFHRYILLAMQHNYDISVIRLESQFGSIHNVPEYVMRGMEERFEDYEGEEVY